jgi:hypothetical protein
MRFRIPAPRKGWVAFLGEVWIIVLGVLIALGAQQLVDYVQWRGDVADARAALALELNRDLGAVDYALTFAPCDARRFDDYAGWVRAARAGTALPDLPDKRRRGWTIDMTAWDVVKTGQTAARMQLEDRIAYSRLYGGLQNISRLMEEEREQRRALRAIVRQRHPDDAALSQAEELIEGMRRLPAIYRANLVRLAPEIARLGLHPDRLESADRAEDTAYCALASH